MTYPCQAAEPCTRPAYFLAASIHILSWEAPVCRQCALAILQMGGARRIRGVDPGALERLSPYLNRREPR
jgi:hypothetical protein